jgi:hypothetical protein
MIVYSNYFKIKNFCYIVAISEKYWHCVYTVEAVSKEMSEEHLVKGRAPHK